MESYCGAWPKGRASILWDRCCPWDPDVRVRIKSYTDLTGMNCVVIDPAQVWLISNQPYVTVVPSFNLILQFLLTQCWLNDVQELLEKRQMGNVWNFTVEKKTKFSESTWLSCYYGSQLSWSRIVTFPTEDKRCLMWKTLNPDCRLTSSQATKRLFSSSITATCLVFLLWCFCHIPPTKILTLRLYECDVTSVFFVSFLQLLTTFFF